MSQVLEKPILLDETGQAIAGKLDTNSAAIVDALDDIKEAIGNSEFIPLMLRVTTPPTKTAYLVGETLDLTGMVVSLIASNGAQIDVTSACTFVPANGATLTAANTSVAISYYYSPDAHTFTTSQAIGVRELSSITVSTPPTKTTYKAGETLDLTGINVLAVYDDGYVESVTQNCVFSPANGATLSTSDSSVSISYTLNGVTKTTSQAILVKELSSIAITTAPTKTTYVAGDTLDLTGIAVTATYSDTSTEIVTSSCTFSPANGTTLVTSNTTVTATYTENEITKTATQAITVNPPVYGVEWDGTASSAWTRTDVAADFTDPVPYYSGMSETPSSPFDNISPWKDMEIVEDTYAGTLVKIPKFYYKLTQDGAKLKIQIANTPETGFSVSPAHMDRGDNQGERDVIYVGRYHCGQDCKSKTGSPSYGYDLTGFRTNIHGLDSDVWQWDFATKFTIWLLYLVEFADWNSQSKIGYGCSKNGTVMNNGYTDSMPYHTGTTETARTTFGGTQYRHIEGLWDSLADRVDGCYYDRQKHLRIILYPYNFANVDDLTGGVSTEIVAAGSASEPCPTQFTISDVEGAFPLFVPTASTSEVNMGDNADVYSCDYWKLVGGYCIIGGGTKYKVKAQGAFGCGMFFMDYKSYDTTSGDIGSRLMKLPNS